jgi:manganese transport protein
MTGSFWKKLLAFAGPGYLVAVGYMDPGNWATDLAGGARYGYTLLSVIMLSNLMAILLQALALRLGIASGRDLAQACRDHYSRPTTVVLWLLCEVAIAACDLAEVIGSAIALNLLFGLPLVWGVCLTACDVLLVLYLQQFQFRYVEVLVVLLILGIAGSFTIELALAPPTPSSGVNRRYASWISATPVSPARWNVAAATMRIAALMNSAKDSATVESMKAYFTASRLPAAVSS